MPAPDRCDDRRARRDRAPRRRLAAVCIAVALTATAGACGPAVSDPSSPSATSPVRPSAATTVPAPVVGHDGADVPTTAPAGTKPAGLPDGWRPGRLDWSDCRSPGPAQCASLTVPLDWSRPTGTTIELALARVRATGGPDERIGSVLTNPGGPGGSGVEFVESSPFDGDVARRFDQVSWDPRGVGRSTAVTCGRSTAPPFLEADPDPDTPTEQRQLDDLARQVSADCAATDAALLAHISTFDVARDMEAIRRALDDGPLNYVGFSYGTQIGQDYAELFPGRIRTMVLDGVVDPSLGFTDFLLGQIDGFDAAFDRNVRGCRDAGARRCGVADLAAAYDAVKTAVEERPIRAGSRRTVGPADLAVAGTYVAYSGDGWRRLGPALADAIRGDGSAIARLADAYHDLGGYGVYAGVVCTDSPPPASPAEWKLFADRARARSPRFGGSVANELLPCATWPVEASGTPAPIHAPGAPPIVVIGNTGDPATPLANARSVARRLASGVLVTADISGHTAYGRDDCVSGIVDSYLLDVAVPTAGTSC